MTRCSNLKAKISFGIYITITMSGMQIAKEVQCVQLDHREYY